MIRCASTSRSPISPVRQWTKLDCKAPFYSTTLLPNANSFTQQQTVGMKTDGKQAQKASTRTVGPIFATQPHSPYHAKVYIFPTLNGQYVFHTRFPRARSSIERFALIFAYALRKWRYSTWDHIAAAWHDMGLSSISKLKSMTAEEQEKGGMALTRITAKVYLKVNELTTRRAADEYFLKSVPTISEHVEFIYPAGTNVREVKQQLSEWLADSEKHRSQLFLWCLIFPADLYLAKYIALAANLFFFYNIFRINAHWRAMTSAGTLQRLINSKHVTWTESRDFENLIVTKAGQVHEELLREQLERMGGSDGSGGTNTGIRVWKWDPAVRGDLHDHVVIELEKDMNLVELTRTYRRGRMEAVFKKTNI
ncbi:hypothetical protein HDU76_012807 [Blyttiomyces sp. JEL0837]|nr:hypothetical protein HDU76_012807 [Blyttiomyces sp. JEL0837]